LKQPGKAVVWPANLDSAKTRQQGRRLPKAKCVESPKLAELEKAATEIGLNPTAVADAARPSLWWQKTGYIIVDRRSKPKTVVLTELAQAIGKLRLSGSKA